MAGEAPKRHQLLSEEQLEKGLQILNQAELARNFVTVNEFTKNYLRFYLRDTAERISELDRNNYSVQFSQRFSLYTPITLIADRNTPEGKVIPIIQLPPLFNRIGTMNSIGATDLLQWFSNALMRDPANPFSVERDAAARKLQKAVLAALPESYRSAELKRYNAIMDQFVSKQDESKNRHGERSSDDVSGDSEWDLTVNEAEARWQQQQRESEEAANRILGKLEFD